MKAIFRLIWGVAVGVAEGVAVGVALRHFCTPREVQHPICNQVSTRKQESRNKSPGDLRCCTLGKIG